MTPDEKPLGPLRSRLLLGLASVTVIGVGLNVAPEPSDRALLKAGEIDPRA